MAVPIFAMITGHLLFGREKVPSISLVLSRFWKIFHLIIYFGIIWYIADTLVGRGYYPFWKTFFIPRIPLWYLNAILPFYMLTGFMSLPQNAGRIFYITLFWIFAGLFLLTNGISSYPFNFSESSYNSVHFLFLYALTGFTLGKLGKVQHTWVFLGTYIFFTLLICFFAWKADNIHMMQAYPMIQIFFQSTSLFLFIRSLDISELTQSWIGKLADRLLSFIAMYSLGIFGWHVIILSRVFYFLLQSSWTLRGYQVIILVCAITFILSLLVSIIDTWFWKKVRKALAPIFQPLGERFLGFVKSIKI